MHTVLTMLVRCILLLVLTAGLVILYYAVKETLAEMKGNKR